MGVADTPGEGEVWRSNPQPNNQTAAKPSFLSCHQPNTNEELGGLATHSNRGSKNPFFFKKPSPVCFIGFYWVFLDKPKKIGKRIQKLSNLKP